MGVVEIPRSFKYTCDRCGDEHVQENAAGHYSNSRPPNWSSVQVLGRPLESSLLCDDCSNEVMVVLKGFMKKSSSPPEKRSARRGR